MSSQADDVNLCEVDTLLSYKGEELEFFKKYVEELKNFNVEFPFYL